MTVAVEAIEPTADYQLERVAVTTTDATGTERRYVVSVTDDTVGGGHVLAGKRVDPEPTDDERAPVGPSGRAWSAAAEHFRARGYEVWGR